VVEGAGNNNGVPAWELSYKSRALEKISTGRVELWKSELSQEQLRLLEGWGGKALNSLGYELTAGTPRLPLLSLPVIYLKAILWVIRRPRYAEAKELFRPDSKAFREPMSSGQQPQ